MVVARRNLGGLPEVGEAVGERDDAMLVSRLVRERHDKIERAEIKKKMLSEQWSVGDVITWDGGEGSITAIGRGRLIKARDVDGKTWSVNPLAARLVRRNAA